MDDDYLMYVTDRSHRRQRREQFSNPGLEVEMSETELSEAELVSPNERRSTPRSRLDSYEQAHASREMLQRMQESYKMRSHNDLFLDEKSIVKRRALICALCGIIIILLIILFLLLGTMAGAAFLYWKSQLEFPTLSLDTPVSAETVMTLKEEITTLFNDIEVIHENMNVTDENVYILIDIMNDNFATSEVIMERLNQLTTATQTNFSMANSQLSAQVSSLESKLRTAQSNITSVHNQANGLQSSLDTITNRISTPVSLYQNCRQETRTCNITTFRDTRLYCSTSAVIINIQNYFTLDVRCEFGLGLLNTLEAPSLLRQESGEGLKVFCQCSMIHPTANGHVALAEPFQIISCTLSVTRCPLSQTVFP